MDDPGAIRWDAAAKLLVLGERTMPLSVDVATGDVTVEVGGAPFRLRPLRWREKRTLSRFAHLGREWVAEQRVRAALGDAAEVAVPEGVRDALASVARWVDEAGGGAGAAGLPLEPTLLATVSRDVCRSLEVGPLDLDRLPAADVEAAWASGARSIEPSTATAIPGRPPAGDDWGGGAVNRIVLLPQEADEEDRVEAWGPDGEAPEAAGPPGWPAPVAGQRGIAVRHSGPWLADPVSTATAGAVRPPAQPLPTGNAARPAGRPVATESAGRAASAGWPAPPTTPSPEPGGPTSAVRPTTRRPDVDRHRLAPSSAAEFASRHAGPAAEAAFARPAGAPPPTHAPAGVAPSPPLPVPAAFSVPAPIPASPGWHRPAGVVPATAPSPAQRHNGAPPVSAAFRLPIGSVAAGVPGGGGDSAPSVDDVCDALAARIEEAARHMGLGGVAS